MQSLTTGQFVEEARENCLPLHIRTGIRTGFNSVEPIEVS